MIAPPLEPLRNEAESREVKVHAEAHFDRWARSYDRSWLNELVFHPSVRRCQEEIIHWRRRRGERPYRMLDVGCGTGKLLGLMARDLLAERLVGLDYSEQMVRCGAERLRASPASDRLAIVRGDAERLPFADESFDVLTCCNSFHHYPHQPTAIDSFRRVLRPGGLLVLIDGFRDNALGWLIFDFAVANIEGHVHHCSYREFKRMLRSAGFREIRQRKMNVLAPLLVNTAEK